MLQYTLLLNGYISEFTLATLEIVSTLNIHYRNVTLGCKQPWQGLTTGSVLKFTELGRQLCSCTVKKLSY